ncbi:hypothetical protein [Glycomyces tenuis]|uniref:hypothetical protein n=1 Tax=Glycomyces tenuis TaxID=58116 RepID=UPI00041378BA|nr:hypothetical protein [Glycomyces tenuis]
MRLTLSVLFAGIILAIPAVLLVDAAFEGESQTRTAAERIGTEFVWPDEPVVADPEAALRILTEAAEATESNVLRTTVDDWTEGRKRITHYVLMGRDGTGLFDEFTLAEGRWLSRTESRTGTATVSSAGGADVVGVPEVLGGRYDLTFAPLHHAFESLPSAGRYVVEAPDGEAAERFLSIVHNRLVEAGATELRPEDLRPDLLHSAAGGDGRLNALAYILAGTATLVAAFILLREGKRIGVLRLMGHSSPRIWYRVVGRLQLATLAAGLAACAACAVAVPGVDAFFVRTVAVGLAEVAAVGFAATLGAGLVVIHRVRIADLIKGSLD